MIKFISLTIPIILIQIYFLWSTSDRNTFCPSYTIQTLCCLLQFCVCKKSSAWVMKSNQEEGKKWITTKQNYKNYCGKIHAAFRATAKFCGCGCLERYGWPITLDCTNQ